MKSVTIAFAIPLVMFCASVPQSPQQELLALNQRLIDALARGDRATVDDIYADEFVRTSVDGKILTKKDVLAALDASKGSRPTTTYESRDIETRVFGSAAVLVYLSIRHSEGKPDFYYRVTDTFVRQNGRWRKAASAGTPIVDH